MRKLDRNMGTIGIIATVLLFGCGIMYHVLLYMALPAMRQAILISCVAAVIGGLTGALFYLTDSMTDIKLFRILLAIGSLSGIIGSLGIAMDNHLGSEAYGMLLAIYISVPVLSSILRVLSSRASVAD